MERWTHAASRLFGIHLTASQLNAFNIYAHELLEWNSQFNLTAIRDLEGIQTKHFLDSLSCALAWRTSPPTRLIDVGTGAGFPGLVLKILLPRLHLTLVESVGKKAGFCRHMIEKLGLVDVVLLLMRAEEVGQMPAHREQYDWAVARAVATLPVLVEYMLPLVHVGGSLLAQKGENGPAEAHAAEKAIHLLGGHLRQLLPVTLPGVVEERYLVLVDKVATTPPAYPRKSGVPSKSPIK